MGIIINGANGGFSGKAGSVIGSSWKKIHYIKGLHKKRTKPYSEKQLDQQARFGLLMRFLMPIATFVKIGFSQKKADRLTPMNVALQYNIERAILGTYPDYTLDYAKISIAHGTLFGAGSVLTSYNAGHLTFTWDTMVSERLRKNADDLVHIVGYHPGKDDFLATPNVPRRADGTVTVDVPLYMQQGAIHSWIFLTDRSRKTVSRSSYLGELIVD